MSCLEKSLKRFWWKDKIYYVLGKIQKETKQILEFGGAKKHRNLSNSVHYIILGENPDLDELDEAYHLGTVDDPTVVKENWVWYSMITGKKLPTEPFSHYEKILDGVGVGAVKLISCPVQLQLC